MRILILHQKINNKREDEIDTLLEVKEIQACLKTQGHEVIITACAKLSRIEKTILLNKPDIVFHLAESFGGSDRFIWFVPTICDFLHIPCTGNSSSALFAASDKRQMKRLLASAGLPVPCELEILQKTSEEKLYIIKSLTEHASFGIDARSVIKGSKAAQELILAKTIQYKGKWLAEEYIEGREINISILPVDGKLSILPMAEVVFSNYTEDMPRIVDYDAKWNKNSHGYHNTNSKFIETDETLSNLAIKCCKILGLNSYTRIDLRIDEKGKAWVIDVNPNPCLSLNAGFMAAASQAGITPAEVLAHIIKTAIYEKNTENAAIVYN